MPTYNKPVIAADDYDTLRRIKDSDFPNTYDEWLNLSAQKETNLRSKSYVILEVQVDPDEFIRDCNISGTIPKIDGLMNFALRKGREKL